MKKYKIITNVLIVAVVFFIILSSVFIYKYVTFKNEILNNNTNSTLNIKAYNEKNELILEDDKSSVAGNSLLKILEKDSRFVFNSGFLNSINGIEHNDENKAYWMVYSPTHSLCKNEVNQSCSVGAGDLFLGEQNEFVFKFETF